MLDLVWGLAVAGLSLWGFRQRPALFTWLARQRPPGARPVNPRWMSFALVGGIIGGSLILLGQAIQFIGG